VPVHLQLSRSRYCYGLQCTKQLWWRVHEPRAPELKPDAAQQAIFDQGNRVGEVAPERFPGGVLVDGDYWDVEAKVEKTRSAIGVYKDLMDLTKDKDPVTWNLALTILQQEVEHEEDLQSLREDVDLLLGRAP
jgi:hypothetical protein